jgi:transcriptional regulator with XRE-family HTH domain
MPWPVAVHNPTELSIEPIKYSYLEPFERKDYRDSYLQARVRGGIAYQIHGLREKCDISQTEFATKIGKKQSVVSRLENTEYGKVTVQTLLDIACSLDVALIVQFVSYPEFLSRASDMSKNRLQPPTIFESIEQRKTDQSKWMSIIKLVSDTNSKPVKKKRSISQNYWKALTHMPSSNVGAFLLDVEVDATAKEVPADFSVLQLT